ncbi:hypothetical protein NDA18_000937 [Ustilago nuda]|nr:hypothetical protein NDA18_000937 [Ustilago nuda]
MRPTTQPQQRSYRQEGWQSDDPYTLAGVASSSSASHTNIAFIPLPTAAPALPPPQLNRLQQPLASPTPSSISFPYIHVAPTSSRGPAIFQARPQSPSVPLSPQPQEPLNHMSAHRPQSPLLQRLVNPYEQRDLPNPHEQTQLVNPHEPREQSLASPAPSVAQNSNRNNASRLSFGPGDPLFSGARAPSAAYPSDRSPQLSSSRRPTSMISPVPQPLPPATPPIPAERTMSNASTYLVAPNKPMSTSPAILQHRIAGHNSSPTASHGPAHEFDDCPGCRAEIEDAIQASLQSAQQEEELRQRQLREQAGLDRIAALKAEENERQCRLAQEEEQLLQQAIEDSRREAEMQLQRKTQEENLLLEESRQYALRQREQDARFEAEMLEAAKLASVSQEKKRRQEFDAMQEAERGALQLSLREQQEEWERRESAERSLLEFLDQRNAISRPTTPSSTAGPSAAAMASQPPAELAPSLQQASSSSSKAGLFGNLDAEYWRFAGHDEAYQLALQMHQVSFDDAQTNNSPGPSSYRVRRPLPQAPSASGSTDPPTISPSKLDPRPIAIQPVNLCTVEEAPPPAYTQSSEQGHGQAAGSTSQFDESEAGPSTRASNVSEGRYDAYPPEKVSSQRYDSHALQSLNQPVLRQRSSSSSSGHSQRFGRLSETPSLSNKPSSPLASPLPTSWDDSSPTPPTGLVSPSIPERGSSQFTPASKRFSQSSVSLNSEQRGQRALAGIEFGHSDFPFAPKLDKSRLPFAQSASKTASSSSCSTTASPSTGKVLFPASIELTNIMKASSGSTGSDMQNSSPSCFFTIRARSWKSLLRALAWYGNSRVEAAPEEVATASDRRARCLLRVEVEFITPTRTDLGYGVAEYAKAAQNGVMPKHPCPAHVALCLSLLPISSSKSSSSGKANAWLKSDEYQTIKRESRRLDAWYASRGSIRRLVQLPRQPPMLPVALVQVAQLLHASHTFSAACPSTGSTARHSPCDLHHAIERHDEGFVCKQKAMLAAGTALATKSGALVSTTSLTFVNPCSSTQGGGRNSSSTDLHRDPDEDDDLDDDEEELEFNDYNMLENGLAANGSFDAQDRILMGRRQRLKAKVKRRLAKRNSDGRVVDEDLATWITPFDLSQHG